MSAWADIFAFDIAAVEGEISVVKSPLLTGSWNAFAMQMFISM